MDIKHSYSFKAVYEDGTVIEQNETDTSEILEGRSRFFDVLEKEKESKLVRFEINGETNKAAVDLIDGHFELNDTRFWQHRPDLEGYTDFRVIYYRTVKRTMNLERELLSGEILGYAIGWQVTETDGNGKEKNVQRIMVI